MVDWFQGRLNESERNITKHKLKLAVKLLEEEEEQLTKLSLDERSDRRRSHLQWTSIKVLSWRTQLVNWPRYKAQVLDKLSTFSGMCCWFVLKTASNWYPYYLNRTIHSILLKRTVPSKSYQIQYLRSP